MTGRDTVATTDPQAPGVIVVERLRLAAGSQLAGRYLLREHLGAGGMGSVWRAFDSAVGEELALKILTVEQGATADGLERFRREVAVTRRIAHPGVCRVFDLGESSGVHFLTMELLAGENLRALLRRGPPPFATAIGLATQILAGVAAAHDAGVMHRDLKPENVVVCDGRAVIVDFGLARPTLGNASTTAVRAGTPAYMAPEQLRDEAVDLRSDVFACGVLVHELLTGAPPFAGESAATLAASILRDAPRRFEIAGVDEAARARIEAVLRRALAKEPAERPATARVLLAELSAAVEGIVVKRRRPRRWVLLAVLAAVVAVAVSAGSATAWWLSGGRTLRELLLPRLEVKATVSPPLVTPPPTTTIEEPAAREPLDRAPPDCSSTPTARPKKAKAKASGGQAPPPPASKTEDAFPDRL